MKPYTLIALTACLVTGLAVESLVSEIGKRGKLEAENVELRLRNAARERVKAFHKGGGVEFDYTAIASAAYNLGTPESVLVAVRQQENGSPLWEFGHQGKTEWIALGIPPSQWQAHEAARTLNKALWRWAMKEHRKEAIKALGKAYTAKAHAARWARNVERIEREVKP